MNMPLVVLLSLPLLCTGVPSVGLGNEPAVIGRVLAHPTEEEVARVLRLLKEKDLRPRDFATHHTQTLPNGNRLRVISHSSECGVHYAAVILPERPMSQTAPVMMFAAGGDGMNTVVDVTTDFSHNAARFPAFLGAPFDSEFIVVIPSFRGQTLAVGDKTFESAGSASDAFVGAATDTIALLNVVLREYKLADPNNIGVYGGSRGGAVALLVAARDERIKRAIVVAAPTDMRKLYRLYPKQFKTLFLDDLLAGKIDEGAARVSFVACSPIHFCGRLPQLQLHHDSNDPFVPAAFASTLVDKLDSEGKEVEAFFYNEGEHGYPSDPDFLRRVQAFIRPLRRE